VRHRDPPGDALGLSRVDQAAVSYAALLRSLGCTAHASAFAAMFDDDVAIQRELKVVDLADPGLRAVQVTRFAARSDGERAEQLADRCATEVPAQGETLARGSCEVSAALGRTKPRPRRWNVARAGNSVPRSVLTFAADIESILGVLEQPDMLATVIVGGPAPRITVGRTDLDRVCSAFGSRGDDREAWHREACSGDRPRVRTGRASAQPGGAGRPLGRGGGRRRCRGGGPAAPADCMAQRAG
jgi:hypothetical protein